MTAALDIITLVLLLGMTFLGYKKGLAKSLLQLFGGILAIVLAFSLSAPVGAFISDSFIKPPIRKMVVKEVAAATQVPVDADVNKTIEDIDVDSALTTVPAPLKKLLDTFGTSAEKIKAEVGDNIDKTTTEYKNKAVDAIVAPVADGVARVISFALLFVLASIALFIISIPLGLVSKIPIIGSFNKLGGAILGAVQGVILVFILSAFIMYITPVISSEDGALKPTTVEETKIFEVFSKLNPVRF